MLTPSVSSRAGFVGLALRRWQTLVAALALAWLMVLAYVQLTNHPQTFPLQGSRIQHESGCAYTVPLDVHPHAWPIMEYVGDSAQNPQASRSRLFEDGTAVGTPHAMHEAIRGSGHGQYSQWGQVLIFSTVDCADPRANGSRFVLTMQASMSRWALLSGLLAACALMAVIVHRFGGHPGVRRFANDAMGAVYQLVVPGRAGAGNIWNLMIFCALLAGGAAYLLWTWSAGRSAGFMAPGGFYQVSDSMGYWLCSNAMLDQGGSGHLFPMGEWCQRRAIYPRFLSGITLLAQRNIFLTLAAQAAIVSTAMYIVSRKCFAVSGVAGMVLSAFLLFTYAMEDVFAVTMTENAGLIFGCVGLTSLLIASERRSLAWMAGGIALVSIGLSARAGAFFILPFLMIWACVLAHAAKERIWKWLGAATLAALAGFVLQVLSVVALGGNIAASNGNFAYVLYGLSVGGKGWSQVLTDFPTLTGSDLSMSKEIYALAWNNISKDPGLFLLGLRKNIALYLQTGTYGFSRFGSWSVFFQVCWWLAWIPIFRRRRIPSYSLVALCSLGVVISMPLLLGDGMARIFAASVAIDVLQVSIGFSWAISVLLRGLGAQALRSEPNGSEFSPPLPVSRVHFEMGFVILLCLLLLLPSLTFWRQHGPPPTVSAPCDSGEYTVITHIGNGGALLLDFRDEGQESHFLKGQVRRTEFLRGIRADAWWRHDVESFSGRSLLLGYQQDTSDPYVPGPYPVFSELDLSDFYGRTVQLCVDKVVTRSMFGQTYRQLNSIKTLE